MNKVLADLKVLKASGDALSAADMLSKGFSADGLVYAGYTEAELTAAGLTQEEYAEAVVSASLFRDETSAGISIDGPQTTDDVSIAATVVPIVLVLALGSILGYIIYRRKHSVNGALNDGGVQRYENPAYNDGSSPSDAKDNITIVMGNSGAAGMVGQPAAPKKRGSFRKAKRDKEGVQMAVSGAPLGPPEWADPAVPFLSRGKAEKKLEANGNINASFVVRQTRSVVGGYVVTSVFDGNVANSQLKNKGGEYYYGTKKVGSTLEEALDALHTTVRVKSIGGIQPYLLLDRVSLPSPSVTAAAPDSESSAGAAKKKKKKKEEKSKAKSNKATKTVVAASNPPANAATAFDSDSNGGVDIDSFFGKMVAAGDTDGDGLVSLEEAIALGMDAATFSAIDADGNGQLTKAEVKSWSEKNEAAAEDMLNEDGDFEC